MAIICSIGLVAFNRYARRTRAFAAQTAMKKIKSECETNYDLGLEERFTLLPPRNYSINTRDKNNCIGGGDGLVSAIPENPNKLPTYFYKHLGGNGKGKLGCTYSSKNDNLFSECNPRKNIEAKAFVVKGSYLERGCSAYVVVKGPTWEDAEDNANEIGGHLVTINDNEENKWLVDSYQKMVTYNGRTGDLTNGPYLPRAWIGLNDKEEEGSYKWSSGEEVTFRGTIDSGHFSGMKKTHGRFNPKTGLRDDSLPLTTAFIEQDVSSITLSSDGNPYWFAGAWEDDWSNNTHYTDGIAEVSLCN